VFFLAVRQSQRHGRLPIERLQWRQNYVIDEVVTSLLRH
jgi:hypothetical protein